MAINLKCHATTDSSSSSSKYLPRHRWADIDDVKVQAEASLGPVVFEYEARAEIPGYYKLAAKVNGKYAFKNALAKLLNGRYQVALDVIFTQAIYWKDVGEKAMVRYGCSKFVDIEAAEVFRYIAKDD
jgi:hypothetical protein